MKVSEMKIPRWMCSVSKLDRIKNEYIRRVTSITKITREDRLRYVERKNSQKDG